MNLKKISWSVKTLYFTVRLEKVNNFQRCLVLGIFDIKVFVMEFKLAVSIKDVKKANR